MEAGPEVSFTEMVRLQDTVADAIRTDPDVAGVVSIVGVSALNTTPNAGHLKITLKPRDAAQGQRHRRHRPAARRRSAPSPASPSTSSRCRTCRSARASAGRSTSTRWSAATRRTWRPGRPSLAEHAASPRRCCARWSRRPRRAACAPWCSVDRETAGRLGVSMQAINDALNDAFGQRQISTIYAQANQYRVVLEAMPQYQSDPAALSRLYVPASRRRAGAA